MNFELLFLAAMPFLFALIAFFHGRKVLALAEDMSIGHKVNTHRLLGMFVPLTAVSVYMSPVFDDTSFTPGRLLLCAFYYLLCRTFWVLGEWKMRKGLFGETIPPVIALGYEVRTVIGLFGFTLFLLAIPGMVISSPTGMLGTALALHAATLIWAWFSGPVSEHILQAKPLEQPLPSIFEKVCTAAKIPKPRMMRFGVSGGIFYNAFAFPPLKGKTGRVFFSQPLLDALDDEEQGAILAHELGHLEEFAERNKAVDVLYLILGTAFTCYMPLLFAAFDIAKVGVLVVPIMILLFIGTRAAVRQQSETHGDLRALELCGNGAALIRSLEKLHSLNFMPRRMDAEAEQASTHPSLGRRIGAIRAHMEEQGTAEPIHEEQGAVHLFHAADDPNQLMLFDKDRAHWLTVSEAFPEGETITEEDSGALRARASNLRSLSYEELASIRLSGHGDVRTLRTVLPKGEIILCKVRAGDAERLGKVLDRVDTQLGSLEKMPFHGSVIAAALFSGFLGFGAMVAGSLGLGAAVYLLLGAVIAGGSRQRAWIVAQGAMSLAAVIFTGFHWGVNWWSGLHWFLALSLLLCGVVCLMRMPDESSTANGFPMISPGRVALIYIVIGAFFILPSVWAVSDQPVTGSMLWALLVNNHGLYLPIFTGAAVLLSRKGSKIPGLLLMILSLMHLPAATDFWFARFANEPLVVGEPSQRKELAIEVEAEAEVPATWYGFQLNVSGHYFLAISKQLENFRSEWVLGDFEGNQQTFRAMKAVFIDEERILLLRNRQGKVVVELVNTDQLKQPQWSLSTGLGPGNDPDLAIQGEGWRIVSGRGDKETRILRGTLGSETFSEHVETLEELRNHYRYVDNADGVYQVAYGHIDRGPGMSLHRLRWVFSRFYQPCTLRDPDGNTLVSGIWVDLMEHPYPGVAMLAQGRRKAWVHTYADGQLKVGYETASPHRWHWDQKQYLTMLRPEEVARLDVQTGEERFANLPYKSDWRYEVYSTDTHLLIALATEEGKESRTLHRHKW